MAEPGGAAFTAANDKFVDEDYVGALELYTTAIEENDTSAEYLVKRATCHIKLEQFTEAIMDANSALQQQPDNARAYLRQGQAYLASKEFGQAASALAKATVTGEKHASCGKMLAEAAQEAGTDVATAIAAAKASFEAKPTPAPTAVPAAAASTPAAKRISPDWYQKDTQVVVTLFIKKLKKEDVECEFTDKTLSLNIKLHTGSDYNLELDLQHTVAAAECSYKVMSTKVEIKLKKKVAIRWTSLEGDGTDGAEGPAVTMASAAQMPDKPKDAAKHKNWDKFAQEAEAAEKEEKKEGDDALNSLFQQIYKDADPETQRAMNKSYQESGGTVLSTNWSEIGAKKTEIKPPTGMEHKKY